MSPIERRKHRKRSELKLILTLIILKLKGPIGRYRLKEMLNLSEQEGFIKTGKIGCELTLKGEEFLESLLKKYGLVDIREMSLESLKVGPENFILQIRGHSIPKSIAELREAAVRAGASGAVLITYERGVLRVPTVYSNLEKDS